MREIVIIGAGFSGASLAARLLANTPRAVRVHLIDRSGRFGCGIAYSTSNPGHLLNVRAGNMSAREGSPDDFIDWLSADGRSREASHRSFASRGAYGAYLEASFRRAARAARPGSLHLVRDAVIACREEGGGVHVALASGATIHADAAVLALGNLPGQTPAPFADADLPAGRFIDNAWDRAALARITPDEDVLLLGTGLTMADAVVSLTAAPRTGRIFALSRRGLAPRSHVETQAARKAPLPDLPITLAAALHEVRTIVAAAARRGEPWQHVMERLRPHTQTLWRRLPVEAQQRFLRHLRPWWDAHRHRAAPHVAAWLNALRASGQLEILAGKAIAVSAHAAGVAVSYNPRGKRETRTLHVAHVLNCTGSCTDLETLADPLIQQMLQEGIIRAHATRMGVDADEEGRPIGAGGAAARSIFTLGPMMRGALLETTAVPEIRVQVAVLAERLAQASTALQIRRIVKG